MKHLLFLCLLVTGCDAKVKVESKPIYDPPGVIPMVQFHERDLGVHGSLWFCTNDNHRFAIAVSSYHHISICEVTDDSLVDRTSPKSLDAFTRGWETGFDAGIHNKRAAAQVLEFYNALTNYETNVHQP